MRNNSGHTSVPRVADCANASSMIDSAPEAARREGALVPWSPKNTRFAGQTQAPRKLHLSQNYEARARVTTFMADATLPHQR